MRPLEFSAPGSLDEAIKLLSGSAGPVGVLGGGTDLIIQYRGGRKELGHMVDVKKIPELNVLSFDAKAGLRLGAAVSCMSLGEFKSAVQHYPGLVEGAELIGSTQIQSRATVGGNVCNGSPAADSICGLIVHNGVCVVQGPKGKREIQAAQMMTGPGKTALQPGEFLERIRIPLDPSWRFATCKITKRQDQDISAVAAGFAVRLDGQGRVAEARLAYGGMAATPKRASHAEAALTGRPWSLDGVTAARAALERDFQPLTDMRAGAGYRQLVAGNLLLRFYLETTGQETPGQGAPVKEANHG